MERVTLKMIADEAGVSIAAVSLALRNRGTISEKLSSKIRATAKHLGYRPNPLLASLASKRFRSVASNQGTPIAILEFPPSPGVETTLRSKRSLYLRVLLREATHLGYAPMLISFSSREEFKRLMKTLYHRMVQGLLLVGSVNESLLGVNFDWNQFSIVQCGRFIESPQFHTVRPNIYQAIKLVFTKLRGRGYQRIGFAIGRHDPPMEDDEARYGAAVAMETGYLRKRDQLPIFQGGFNDQQAFLRWVEKTKPEVVVGFSASFYWHLKDQGYRIPEDIGFATLHLNPEDASPVRYAGLLQKKEEIARQSVILLDQLIRNRERGKVDEPLHILVPSKWQDGDTVLEVGG